MNKEYKETVVLELCDGYAIVMDPGGYIHKIKRKDNMKVGDVIYYFEEDEYVPNVRNLKVFRKVFTGIALVAALVFAFIRYIPTRQQSVYADGVVSIGVTEGVQLELDSDNNIISVKDFKGQEVESNWKDKKISDVYPDLVDYVKENKQNEIIISSANKDENKNLVLKDDLIKHLTNKQDKTDIIYIQSTIDNYKKATENNISLVEYELQARDITYWSQAEGDKLSQKEKEDILGKGVEYFKVRESKPKESSSQRSSSSKERSSRQRQSRSSSSSRPRRARPRRSSQAVDRPTRPRSTYIDDDDDYDDDYENEYSYDDDDDDDDDEDEDDEDDDDDDNGYYENSDSYDNGDDNGDDDEDE